MIFASRAEAAGGVNASPSGRRRIFRVIAVLMAVSGVAFGLFTAVFGIVAESQESHAFHNVVVAALLLILSAPAVIAIARAPERSMGPLTHLAAVGIAGVATMALSLTIDPFTLPFVVLVGVLWALRPSGERLFPTERPSPILLVMVVAGAAPLVAYALGHAELQRIDNISEHAEFYHWVETSFYAVGILLLGLLAAVRPGVSRLSAWTAGVALAILGAASLTLPDYASALDMGWAWAALVGGFVFVAVGEWQRRRLPVAPSPSEAEERGRRRGP